MTHRSDRDWHGWDLQTVTDKVAEKAYVKMRETWPEALRKDTAEQLADAPANIQRQVKEAVLPAIVDVLDVLNDMPHPFVTEIEHAFTELQAAYDNREHGAVAQVDCLHKIQNEILPRYTNPKEND